MMCCALLACSPALEVIQESMCDLGGACELDCVTLSGRAMKRSLVEFIYSLTFTVLSLSLKLHSHITKSTFVLLPRVEFMNVIFLSEANLAKQCKYL
jgi:hypothetical protein